MPEPNPYFKSVIPSVEVVFNRDNLVPEQRLYKAILEDAINQFRRLPQYGARSPKPKELLAWFGSKAVYPGSFVYSCYAVGIDDPQAFWETIQREAGNGHKKPKAHRRVR